MALSLCSAVVDEAAEARTRPSQARLALWVAFIVVFVVAAYAQRGTRAGSDAVFKYSTFENGVVFYAVWLGVVLLIAFERFDLLALRPPSSWGKALRLAVPAAVVIVAADVVATYLPLPQNPGKEQGIAPTHWEPAHAGAFAANLVLLAVIDPFVEELTFRGEGQSLLRVLGRVPSILVVGVAFGLAHGLLEGLVVLIPFGVALAWLRDRTESVVPGMIVHGLFNGLTLVLAVVR
jgi:membrane protease YdiL (CAAX protease family)